MAEACRPYTEISIQALYDYKGSCTMETDGRNVISIQALYDYKNVGERN